MWSLDENHAIVVRYFEGGCWGVWGFFVSLSPFSSKWNLFFLISAGLGSSLYLYFWFDFFKSGHWDSHLRAEEAILPTGLFLEHPYCTTLLVWESLGENCFSELVFGGQGLLPAGCTWECAWKFGHSCKFPLNWWLCSVTPEPQALSPSPMCLAAFALVSCRFTLNYCFLFSSSSLR